MTANLSSVDHSDGLTPPKAAWAAPQRARGDRVDTVYDGQIILLKHVRRWDESLPYF